MADARVWEDHKDVIRRLYLMQNYTIAELIEAPECRSLAATKSQMEYRLKKWQFRRNMNREAWQYVGNKVADRKAIGKPSLVLLSGVRLSDDTVRRNCERYRDTSIWSTMRLQPSRPPTPENLCLDILTPPSSPISYLDSWIRSLPWIQFQTRSFESLSNAALRKSSAAEAHICIRDNHEISIPSIVQLLTTSSAVDLVKSTMSYVDALSLINNHLLDSGCDETAYPPARSLGACGSSVGLLILRFTLFQLSNNSLCHLYYGKDTGLLLDLIHSLGLTKLQVPFLRDHVSSTFAEPTISAASEHLFSMALHQAARRHAGAMSLVSWLLSTGFNPNTPIWAPWKDESRPSYTALQVATKASNRELVKLLLDLGADPNFLPSNCAWGSPIELAASIAEWTTATEISQVLLRCQLDAFYIRRAFPHAIRRGNLGLAKILRSYAACNARLLYRRFGALEYAAEYSADRRRARIVELDMAPMTALDLTAYVLDYLVELVGHRDLSNYIKPCHFVAAVKSGSNEVIQLLVRFGGDAKASDRFHSPLHQAATEDMVTTCAVFLDLGAQVDGLLAGLTPLNHAARAGSLDTLKFLISRGADVNKTFNNEDIDSAINSIHPDYARHTALLAALEHRHESCAQYLLEMGADLVGGEMSRAIRLGNCELVKAVFKAMGGAEDLSRALQVAIIHEEESIACLLLRLGASVTSDHLLTALRMQDNTLAMKLLAMEFDPETRSDDRESLLELAIRYSTEDIRDVIFRGHGYVYDAGQLCAAVLASSQRHQSTNWIRTLLLHRPVDYVSDVVEGTALGLAGFLGNTEAVKILLQIHPCEHAHFPDYTDVSMARMPEDLYFKQETDLTWEERLKIFFEFSPCPFWHLWHSERASVLAIAVCGRHETEVLRLLRHGYRPDSLTLSFAIAQDNLDLVRQLLAYMSDVPAAQAIELLILAVRSNSIAITKEILSLGADINGSGTCGIIAFYMNKEFMRDTTTPLRMAAALGNTDMATFLIEQGANAHHQSSEVEISTALQAAAAGGHLGVAMLLLRRGTEIDTRVPKHSYTALEIAAANGKLDMVQLLLSAGATTEGFGQEQYVRATFLAESNTNFTVARLLRRHREWTSGDHDRYDDLKNGMNPWVEPVELSGELDSGDISGPKTGQDGGPLQEDKGHMGSGDDFDFDQFINWDGMDDRIGG